MFYTILLLPLIYCLIYYYYHYTKSQPSFIYKKSTKLPTNKLRIAIVGLCGSGKSTLAAKLAKSLNLHCIHMDDIFWKPNWEMTPKDEHPQIIEKMILEAEKTKNGWVIDGNYSSASNVIWAKANIVVHLDYNFWVSFVRLFIRTVKRLVFRERICNGNVESWKTQFWTKESIFLWAWRTYVSSRQRILQRMEDNQFEHLEVIKLVSPAACELWFEQFTKSRCTL